ncbi:epimerase [Psychrobacter sp. FDAARGOS_221]|uniref:epimerase n=1 Tax=Psychrobacter sp. FDAARGOS_221 TaxID=1975705 RepID=UPI000BB57AEE|nr:DUF1731 domain-containing protein [Psychrobacter sp. FDAARGOS_221]PNK60744.1 DUF1731 domain-containing protein [Psychrobacter sp. FDAARGOS_221]
MKILISGGTGLIGTAFSHWVQNRINGSEHNQAKHQPVEITWLTRDINQAHPDFINMMSYEQLQTTEEAFDIVMNLAGAGIADKRWSEQRKQLLMQSRIKPTQALMDYIARIEHKPKLMLSGSAIGWYGNQGHRPLDETSPFEGDESKDFAHHLCAKWEAKASEVLEFNVPVVILRTGIVIHPKGGMLAKLLPSFKMGMGGKLGDGNQMMSWISLNDWVRAAWHIIEQHLAEDGDVIEANSVTEAKNTTNAKITSKAKSVIYNLTAPDPVRNAVFTQIVGDWLHRPTLMTLPASVLKLMFGEMATLLIDGQKVLPNQLLNTGFKFEHIALKKALVEQYSITNLN